MAMAALNMSSGNIQGVRKTFPPLWGLVSTSLIFLFVLFHVAPSANSAHIVFFHNIASYSHRVTTYPLADALAKRGHQITFINPFVNRDPYVNPNITEIVPASVKKSMEEFLSADFDINHRITKTFQRIVFAVYPAAIQTCQDFFDSPELEEFYKGTKSVELVIIDNFMAECAVALAYKYGAKHIIFNTVTHLPNEFDQWGFQPETSSIPEYEIDPPIPPMTFYERVVNALVSIHFRWEHYKFMGALDFMVRSHLKDPSMPFLDDLVRNASLVFYPGDVVTDHPRSQSPLFVNIGGIYCKNASGNLPSGLMEFLEEGPHFDGLAYISLGSLALSSNLPERVKQVFMDTIRQFPKLRFIWKWDSPIPENKPENLYLAKWLPQTEILAHPKMKLFVTQCGRPSMSEALCNGVPMIAFPVLGDQDNNANRMEKMGANVKLELGTVTIQQFKEAVEKTVYDKR